MNDETIVATMLMTKPIPIRCKHVMPEGCPVNRLASGTKRRSYKTRPESVVRMPKMDRLAGGISNDFVKCRSMVRACWITKLCRCEDEVTSKIPAAQIGNIRMIVLSSSTLWTVTNLHRLGGSELADSDSVTTAALSNHLKTKIE